MKNLKITLLLTGIVLLISGCASRQFVYRYKPNPVQEEKIPVSAYFEVNIEHIRYTGARNYPHLKADIQDVLKSELSQVFQSVTDDADEPYDIRIVMDVKQFRYANQSWPMIFPSFFVLGYIGSPIGISKASVAYEVNIFGSDNQPVTAYQSTKEVKKWVGLYYNMPTLNPISAKFTSYVASQKAMDAIKPQILADRDEMEKYMTVQSKYTRDTVIQREVVYVEKEGAKYQFDRFSDVDRAIPVTRNKDHSRFALIIGNEDYATHQVDLSSEVDVDFARNDASAFKMYAESLLGIPEDNILFLLDATTGQMNQAISKMNLIIKNTQGRADVFVYYAGHGLPDEETRTPYLMPVDVSGRNAADGIPLQTLYDRLTEYPSSRVTVFIDACFSGGARNQGLIAARGVKVVPKASRFYGNLVAFTSSSGNQSSLPFNEQKHGLFTYFLLKKLKESGGDIQYGALSNYLRDKISLQSVLKNDKEQTPYTYTSTNVSNEWKSWNFLGY